MNEIAGPEELVTMIQGVRRWTLEVMESRMVTPRMHRIRLGSAEFGGFDCLPGQDVMLWVPADGERMVYRRYTVRHFDRMVGSLDLDVFDNGGGGPGERWAQAVRPGDVVDVVGPRGKVSLVAAPWHLFAGDESYIPAAFAMLEALPTGTPAWAFLEVAGPEEEQCLSVGADVQLMWIHRGDASPGNPTDLVTAVGSVKLPASPGRAYVGAELQVAKALSRALEAHGFDSSRISSKAYWGRGRANASIGEPKENDAGR